MQLSEQISGKWLEETRQISSSIWKVADCLLLLSSKRSTLEEKMLACFLNKLVAGYGEVLTSLHLALSQPVCPGNDELLGLLTNFNAQVVADLDELLKMSHYDLNFLEQYFEHDFYSRVTVERKYLDRLEEIKSELASP